jgi:hypothetical protein
MRIVRISLLQPTGEWLRSGEYEAAVREVLKRITKVMTRSRHARFLAPSSVLLLVYHERLPRFP